MACQTRIESLEAVDGLDIYCEVHTCPSPKGVILAVHDYGEHCGAYHGIFDRLCQEGYTIYAADLRGHGKSAGERGAITHFDDYLEDLDLLMARIKDREPTQPVFILGQGLGALIATCFAMSRKPRMKGLILCGLLMDLPIGAMERLLMRHAGFLLHNSKAMKALREVLLAPALQGALKQDDLAFRGSIKPTTVREILGACAAIQKSHDQLPFAILSIHALEAVTSRASALERWLDAIASVDKSVQRYEGQDHHLLLHKERDQVVGDIIEWCEKHRLDGDDDEEEEWDELAHDAL
ncbi:MAG TPA: alpha/beta fold hydrolase [Oligoflexus sp.]|uniref:alpha/beta fold hydrolase n=1 Tax=Oligoflexus sp. TaxID=1971216 RepID=UPI002D5E6D63|nr:alpha/beta fold hydrolase [Oligoflexus sp.]HYX37429.1 alpha/beta fold hydrolase [Oligoflexus sp.]